MDRRNLIPNEAEYLETVLVPIRVCANYKPKFGQGSIGEGLSLEQFQILYGQDAFYSWFGLDNPLMYAAHKAAGGMTSIYRQIGIGCERLFRRILMDSLGLDPSDVVWSYDVPVAGGKFRKLSLDGRVPLYKIGDPIKRERFHTWMRESAERVGVKKEVFDSIEGTVFEVRQGYKSKDAKRQNADIANAAKAYTSALLPCAVILSNQIDGDILLRYRAEQWTVVVGVDGINDPTVSTYEFMRDIVGYDLADFFSRNSQILRTEIDYVLNSLLAPETP